jgi:hypothetical protein
MLSFSISWTVPSSGRFGFTTIEECHDQEDAVEYFCSQVRGKDPKVPADAQIDSVRKLYG